MSKQSGLGDNLYVAGYDVSGDIGSLTAIGGGPAALQVTGIDKSAVERIGGLRDGRLEFTSYFNPDTDRSHERFSTLPTADQIMSYIRGPGLGNQAACLNAKQINYDGSRADDGSFTFSVQGLANQFGLEWGTQLTDGKRTDSEATEGDSLDVTGTSATIKLQQSSDDGVSDTWADVTDGAFSSVTGVTSERIETARDQAVEQYLRVVTTGTFTNLVFAVVVMKNEVEVLF
jgi:hypothetical protein